jgi:hypothetical protein
MGECRELGEVQSVICADNSAASVAANSAKKQIKVSVMVGEELEENAVGSAALK